MQKQFLNYEVQKTYLTLVRGFTEEVGSIDYALKTDKGNSQEAISHYTTLQRFEVPISLGKFSTSRYSLVEVKPKTGRTHQIRRHMAHISHPIIGDRRHGCNRQNNLFRDHAILGLDTMLLHASSLTFTHPVTDVEICLHAELQTPFQLIVDKLGAMSVPSELLFTSPPADDIISVSTSACSNTNTNAEASLECSGAEVISTDKYEAEVAGVAEGVREASTPPLSLSPSSQEQSKRQKTA
jgi:hypothetical protein